MKTRVLLLMLLVCLLGSMVWSKSYGAMERYRLAGDRIIVSVEKGYSRDGWTPVLIHTPSLDIELYMDSSGNLADMPRERARELVYTFSAEESALHGADQTVRLEQYESGDWRDRYQGQAKMDLVIDPSGRNMQIFLAGANQPLANILCAFKKSTNGSQQIEISGRAFGHLNQLRLDRVQGVIYCQDRMERRQQGRDVIWARKVR